VPSGSKILTRRGEEEEALIQLLETPTNSNHQSTVSKELKFKKSSSGYDLITGKILKEFAYYWNKISYPVFQCCRSQRVLPGTIKSLTDNPHLEAKETA
jgi:hypothetical protein